MKTLKRDPFGNRAVKSPTIPGKYNDSFFFFCTQGRYSCQRFVWENGSIALMAGKKDLENHGSLKIWIRFQKID